MTEKIINWETSKIGLSQQVIWNDAITSEYPPLNHKTTSRNTDGKTRTWPYLVCLTQTTEAVLQGLSTMTTYFPNQMEETASSQCNGHFVLKLLFSSLLFSLMWNKVWSNQNC